MITEKSKNKKATSNERNFFSLERYKNMQLISYLMKNKFTLGLKTEKN